MRVVPMRLKLEIILFNKMYHPSYGSSFTSVSTYLQKNRSRWPSSNTWGMRVRASHMPSQRSSPLTEWQLGHKVWWVSCHWGGYQLAWSFQGEGNTTHSGPTCYLHKYGSFPEHEWQFWVHSICQKLHPRNTHYKLSVGKKICDCKRPNSQKPWIGKTRKEGERIQY